MRFARLAAPAAALCLALAGCNDSGAPAGAPSAQASGSAPGDVSSPAGPGEPTGPNAAAQAVGSVDTSGWKLQPPFYATAAEEPLWRLTLDNGYFVFNRGPGLPEIDARFVAPSSDGVSDVFETERFKLTIQPGACLIRGQTGQAEVTVELAGVVYDGCAFTDQGGARPATGDEAELTEAIPDAIGAIDSCLGKLGEVAVVTSIYPRGDESMGVGLRSRNNALYECLVSTASGQADRVDPVEASAAGAWLKSTARFLRAGLGDASKCADTKPVQAGGQTLGVLVPRNCRF